MFHELLQSRWFTALAIVIIGFFIISLIKIEPALVATQKELANLQKKITETQKSASELEWLGDYIKSDAYLERQARLKLNYKKPDEKVVYIYNAETEKSTEAREISRKLAIFDNKLIVNLGAWWGYLIGEQRNTGF